MANICKNLEQQLKDLNMSFVLKNTQDYWNDNVKEKDADEITVYDYTSGVNFKSFRLPKKKLVNFDWVMSKWNAEKTFVTFVSDFKNILKERGYTSGLTCYPTSYGIGVFIAIGFRDQIKQIKTDIDTLMNDMDIEYKNQYSDAGWVFRYVISKKKENIEKIEQFKSN